VRAKGVEHNTPALERSLEVSLGTPRPSRGSIPRRRAMIVIYWYDRAKAINTKHDADKLRGLRFPMPERYDLSPEDFELFVYLHNEIILPASTNAT